VTNLELDEMAGDLLRIGIVGSGTAGPAAAIFLARMGHEVRLFERAPRKLPVGAGFLLQSTGMAVLRRLGLLEALLPQVARVSRLYCRTKEERVLLDLSYEELGEGLFGAGTHRATFLDLLLEAAECAGAVVNWGVTMTGMSRGRDAKPVLHEADGRQHGPFDLVVICDGAQSTLRGHAEVPARVTRYPWGALWFIGHRTPEFDPRVLWQSVDTTRRLVGVLPTGTSEDLLSVFWSVKLDQIPAWRRAPLEVWKDQILKLAPQAEVFLQQIRHHEQLATAVYHDVRMRQWHGERVVLLGDAAHALSPQLGQGVNLALMDAAALADALTEERRLADALPRYSRARRQHLRFYQFATRWMIPFFQSDALPLGWLRDVMFPLVRQVPWVRRQMTATMAGGKTGVFWELPPG
jgi:2-polyprenyl-6-methoxyphenol hydroxylase-like FAD-dependent oxidoreductase